MINSLTNFVTKERKSTFRHDIFVRPQRVLIQKLDIEGQIKIKNHAWLFRRWFGLVKVTFASFLILLLGALSMVGQTISYYGDKEKSTNNLLQTGLVDFTLTGTPFAHLATSSNWQVAVNPNNDSNPFYYYASSTGFSGDLDLCQALVVKVKVEEEQLYHGPLLQLITATTTNLGLFSYTFTNFSAFAGKTCTFKIDYRGWQTRHDYDEGGYSDFETVEYSITVPSILINQVFIGEKPGNNGGGPCLAPNTLGSSESLVINNSGEKTLQTMLNEHGFGAINVVNDQKSYQVWNVLNPEATSLTFNAKVLGKRAQNTQILGYYKAGTTTTFTNILTQATNTNGEEDVSVNIPPQFIDSFGFAIISNGKTWYSEKALNIDGKDHLAVYEPSPDTYLLAFEDLPNNGDSDYNDLVLKISDIVCHDDTEEEEEELVIDIGDGLGGVPVCTDILESPVTLSQSQVLLSHDEGGAFIGPSSTFIPAGNYNFTALSYDDHTEKPWDNLTKEIWHLNLYNSGNLVFTTQNTLDLPTGINWQVSQLDQNVTLPDIDAVEWVHGAFPDPTYHSIHPSCLWLTEARETIPTAFVQLINRSSTTVDLAGYKLCDTDSCDVIPPGSPAIPGNGFAYLVGDLNDLPDDLPEGSVVILLPDEEIGSGIETEAGLLQLFNSAEDKIDQMNWGEVDNSWPHYDPSLWTPGLNTRTPQVYYLRMPSGFDTDEPSDWEVRDTWEDFVPFTISLRILSEIIEEKNKVVEEVLATSSPTITDEVSTSTSTATTTEEVTPTEEEEESDDLNDDVATSTEEVIEESSENEEAGNQDTPADPVVPEEGDTDNNEGNTAEEEEQEAKTPEGSEVEEVTNGNTTE